MNEKKPQSKKKSSRSPSNTANRTTEMWDCLQIMAEHSSDCIVRLDPNHRYLYINEVFARMIGYPRSRCLGKTNAELELPAAFTNCWRKTLNRIIQSAKPEKFKCRCRFRQQPLQVDCCAVPQADGVGQITSVIGLCRVHAETPTSADTPKRINEQKPVLQSHADLLDLAHDTIMVHDLDGTIKYWNNGAARAYGWTKEEAVGGVYHDLLKTVFHESPAGIKQQLFQSGSWEGELIHTTKHKHQLTVESRWVLRTDDSGRPPEILVIDRDITKRIAAEKETREARKYAESIIETIQEALVVLGSDLKVLSANKSFYQLFSLTPAHTEHRFIYELDNQQWNIPDLRKLLEDILPKNSSFQGYEMRFTPSNGTPIHLLLNARRIYQDEKKTEMILLAIQDITSLIHEQEQVRNLTEKLLLAEERQRQNIATELHDSIGQILAFSNRELAGLLKTADPETARILQHVKDELSQAVKQSRELTADLSSPTLNTFGLEAGIEELTDRFSRQHQYPCRFESSDHVPKLPKNIELIVYQAAKELLCNIVKHAQADRVRVKLQLSDNMLELTVTDNGTGFDTASLQDTGHINCRFGLFSIRQRLTNLGGAFMIKSKKNNGTQVILQVPLDIPGQSPKRSSV